jgi:hypothetical protein
MGDRLGIPSVLDFLLDYFLLIQVTQFLFIYTSIAVYRIELTKAVLENNGEIIVKMIYFNFSNIKIYV